MARKSGSGGYKRTSSTAKGTGVRRTTTHNRSTGTTRTTSIKNGKNGRVTYTTSPTGKTKITRTYKGASGYITRTTSSPGGKTKIPKPKKVKAFRPPKAKAVKFTTGKTRRRRSSGGSGCAVILFAPFAITLLTYLTNTII